ncbi:MAG TPA: hypothetical protein PLO50_11725, partial [Nitrospira sp.]|nr:hypothetical protein [Nitrospira sp.]
LLTIILLLSWGIGLQSALAFDDLRQSSRVAGPRISLTSYERIPIASLLAHPDRYQMRDVRITGTIIALQTDTVSNRMICGSPHERTTLTLEDDSGQMEVIDQGACGKNVGTLKAPMLKAGEQIDLLVQIMVTKNPESKEAAVETTVRFLDRVRF